MKFVKHLSFVLLGALVLFACQKEYSVETGGLGGIITSQWAFKEGAVQFKGSMDTARIDTVSGISYLTLQGISDSGSQRISISVFGASIKASSYNAPAVTFSYTDLSSNVIYQNDLSATSGFNLIITRIDSTEVTGTFSGNVKNAAGTAKTVMSGRFSALFSKTSNTPVSNNCKIAKILQYDTSGRLQGPTTVYTYNTSNRVNKVEFLDSASGLVFNSFTLTFPTNRIQLDARQYFVTDASGRVTEYHGFLDPTDDSSGNIVATYTYNATGQLAQRKIAYATAPAVTVIQVDYTWTGGNLTRAQGMFGGTTISLFDVAYEYDNTKPVKNFISFPALAFEISFFQSAINTGSVPVNALIKTTARHYDTNGTGTPTGTSITNFTKYIIDSNNYVQSFVTSGDDFVEAFIFSGEKYVFRYRCF